MYQGEDRLCELSFSVFVCFLQDRLEKQTKRKKIESIFSTVEIVCMCLSFASVTCITSHTPSVPERNGQMVPKVTFFVL